MLASEIMHDLAKIREIQKQGKQVYLNIGPGPMITDKPTCCCIPYGREDEVRNVPPLK